MRTNYLSYFGKLSLIFLTLSFCISPLHAFKVNRLNGGGSVTYIDFSIPGRVAPLEVTRTYNSITAASLNNSWEGIFGWGWTTEFETTLTVTPQRNVLLRDGASGNTILFKPRKEDPRLKAKFLTDLKRAYFERQQGRKITDSALKNLKLPQKILSKLRVDPKFRLSMSSKYGIKGEIPKGQVLVSTKYGYQTIQYKNGKWIREKQGVAQYFDDLGRLIRQADRNGYYFDYKYSKSNKMQLQEIITRDRTASVKFRWKGNRIVKITDNKGETSVYKYDPSGHLVLATDSRGVSYGYRYDNKKFPHLLTRIEYLADSSPTNKVERNIGYSENGLINFHRNKRGTVARYQYGKKSNNPRNNFWTRINFSNRKNADFPSEIYEQYQIKNRANGSRYLYKQTTANTFRFGTKKRVENQTIIFTACCGKPLQVIQNGLVSKYKYYGNGLLKEKRSPTEDLKFEYDSRFNHISKLTRDGKQTTYNYDRFGNLILVANKSIRLSLKYDNLGRITEMDSGKRGKNLKFEYGDQGRPVRIVQRGVGDVRFSYAANGGIRKTESFFMGKNANRKPTTMQADRMVTAVMASFQGFLDLVRPAARTNYEGVVAWAVE